ncbi:MAG: hypothetical protein AB1304_05760 [Bacteroidota bacterium]
MVIFRKIIKYKIISFLLIHSLYSQEYSKISDNILFFPDYFCYDTINFTYLKSILKDSFFIVRKNLALETSKYITKHLMSMGESSIFFNQDTCLQFRFIEISSYLKINYLPFVLNINSCDSLLNIQIKYSTYDNKKNEILHHSHDTLIDTTLLTQLSSFFLYPALMKTDIACYDCIFYLIEIKSDNKYHYIYRDGEIEPDIKNNIKKILKTIKFKHINRVIN